MNQNFFQNHITDEEYQVVKGSITEENRNVLRVMTSAASIITIVLTITSFFLPAIAVNKVAYIASAIFCVCLRILVKIVPDHFITTLCYIFFWGLIALGIVVGVFADPLEIAATFMVLMIAVPLVFTDRPKRMNQMITLATALFIVMSYRFKPAYIFATDVVNAVSFGILSLIANTYMMNIKLQRHLFEDQIWRQNEFDALTGLRNRNRYEEALQTIGDEVEDQLVCVFLDVNGLHELNNTKGHQAGDRMLISIAESFNKVFVDRFTYRIGGDEYVAFLPDWKEQEVLDAVHRLQAASVLEGYHVSIGYSIQRKENLDTDKLIKDAEQYMYEDKSAYYRQIGNDRRAR